MPSIYRKTAKGISEIETRANKLLPRLRTALIMVDGKRSDAELRPLLQPTPDESLSTLLAQGYIERTGSAAPAVAAPAPAQAAQAITVGVPELAVATPAPAAPNGMRPMPVPLPHLQRDAVRLLTDQVGPMGEAVALRIEKVRSTEELKSAVLLAAQVIANTRGRQAAEAYVARFADI
jgi:hypothetical protein